MMKRLIVCFLSLMFMLNICLLTACSKKQNAGQNFLGRWECELPLSHIGLTESPNSSEENQYTTKPAEVHTFHEITFQKEDEGIWTISSEDHTLDAERSFHYQINGDQIIFSFEDQAEQEYSFAFNQTGDELTLKNEKMFFELKREK